ncbi:MAG: MFS transporter [Alphaproteobacteria bacterium]|nr:MFS transporter [Alphaproteobacteria bacterium]
MTRDRINFFFLNIGHFLDHLFILIFATVAALRLATEWNMTYSELIPYATPGFVAFGVCAVPAGWLADKWSREGMMTIFFIGIGAASMLTALAETPLQIGAGLLLIGVFAAIYHPVGIAMVVHGRTKTGVPLAINGIFGNMGVACAALLTGLLIDTTGWRAAFVLPGIVSIAIGVAYALFVYSGRHVRAAEEASGAAAKKAAAGTLALDRDLLIRVFVIIFFSTAVGGLIFQSTTFALPKVFDERLTDLAGTATMVGGYAFLVFALAAFAQLVVGYLVDHHSVRLVFAFVAGLQAVFFAIMLNLTGLPALLVSFGFMLVVFGQIPINDVLVGRITRSEWRSRVYALRYITTLSVAATAVPLIAWIHAAWGFATLFGVMAVAAACIFAAVLMLPSTAAVTGRPGTAPAE